MKRRELTVIAAILVSIAATFHLLDQGPVSLFEAEDLQHRVQTKEINQNPRSEGIPHSSRTSEPPTGGKVSSAFRKFVELKRHTLRDQDQARAYADLLIDPETLDDAAKTLFGDRGPELDPIREMDRMKAVEFFLDGIREFGDSMPPQLEEAIHKVLTTERLLPGMSIELRKSLLGDQIEIMVKLAEAHPSLAARAIRDSQGSTPHKAYINLTQTKLTGEQS